MERSPVGATTVAVVALMHFAGCASRSAAPHDASADGAGSAANPDDASDARTYGMGLPEAGVHSGPARCEAAGGACVQGVSFCADVRPDASAASCIDLGPTLLCCAQDPDAGCTEIAAANYDRSCAADSDCTRVNVGNACYTCAFACGLAVDAIAVAALPQYQADVVKTAGGISVCGCPEEPVPPGPCCRAGQCHADESCIADASVDAD